MTHKDYERAANHWKIKDASDEKMDRDTLLKEIEQYIKSNNTCALATGADESDKSSTVQNRISEFKKYGCASRQRVDVFRER
mgnify:FL=1|jgi:hypothetical protein